MNSKVNKCNGGIRSGERINSQIIASRDEVEQYATNIDHQRVGFSTPRSRYHLPPTTPRSHFVERDNRDKKIKDTAEHFVWIVVSLLTLSIILYYLIINHGTERKMLRERVSLPNKSKIIVERDVDRTPYNVMFQFERAHWINNGPEIDDLMEISQMLSDKEVSAADLRKAIAIMHTKVNRYDEFTDKCNFVLTSMREVYEDAEDFKWICSDNSLTQANLDWYLSKERAHWINNGPEKDNLIGIVRMLSDEKVSVDDLRKAIAIMPTEVFPEVHDNRYDEFAEKCNYVFTSITYFPAESEKTSGDIDSVSRYWKHLHDAENLIQWICSDSSLTAATK